MIDPSSTQAALRVRMKDADRFGAVLGEFADRKDLGVDSVLDQRDLVKRIFSVLDGARNAAFAVAVVLAIAAMLLIVNMIQIAAFTRRTGYPSCAWWAPPAGTPNCPSWRRWWPPWPAHSWRSAGCSGAKALFFDRALEDLYGVNILARITNSDVLIGVAMAHRRRNSVGRNHVVCHASCVRP